MNKLFSWAFDNTVAATASQGTTTEAGEKFPDKDGTQGALSTTEQSVVLIAPDVDLKVAEFFADFPEPYRQKAIQRFTSDMQRERKYALLGTFLEDRREAGELERQNEELVRKNKLEEQKEKFYERQIPKWEQATLKVIPLQPGDKMALKLFQSSGLVIVAALSLVSAVLKIKHNSSVPKWKVNISRAAGLYISVCCSVLAASRLMDLDIFDRSVDDRYWYEKLDGEVKTVFRQITDGFD